MEPARSLVIGASGQIGRSLIPRLLENGYQVFALSRMPRISTHRNLHWLQGDVFGEMPALPAVQAVFSLGPLNGFADWLATSRLDGGPRIVAFGSMSAVSKRDSPDAAERELSRTLQDAELRFAAAAKSKGSIWTLLRPTLIYGAGLDNSLTPLVRLATRYRLFPRLPGATGLRQPVHVEDLAIASLSAVTLEAAIDRSFDLGGGERLSFCAMLDRVRDTVSVRTIPVPIPLFAARAALNLARQHRRWRTLGDGAVRRLRIDLLANDEAARRELGWAPRAFRPNASTWQPLPLS